MKGRFDIMKRTPMDCVKEVATEVSMLIIISFGPSCLRIQLCIISRDNCREMYIHLMNTCASAADL